MEKIIMTMPIAPYDNFSIGKMSTPILADFLAQKMDAKFVLAVNQLDAYKKRKIDNYLELLQQYGIKPDYVWIDSEHKIELLDKINYLIDNNYIYSDKRAIMSCDCKKVEIPVVNLETINLTDSCFYKKNNQFFCKSCNMPCKVMDEDVLIFQPKLLQDREFNFYPEFINKDIKTFTNTIMENEIVLSRKRNTGVTLEYGNKSYNIDIDFLWQVYLSLFPNANKIVMCSNHQLYQLFIVSMLEKCYNNNGNTISLATPYLNSTYKNEQELKNRILSLKIFTVLNQKWAKKENVINEGLLNYINSMNVNKKEMLYEILQEKTSEEDMLKALKEILTKDFNFQNANNELKRRRKNV